MSRGPSILLIASSMLACGPGKSIGIADDDTSTTFTTESAGEPGDGDGDGDGDDSPSETADGGVFVPDDDTGWCSICDTFAQDCPQGSKCVPGPDTGESCGPPSCLPVMGDKLPGEPCSFDGNTDDCGEGSWCYPAALGVDGPAICVAFCEGTIDDSSCSDRGEICVFDRLYYGGDLGCRPRCDPFAPDACMANEVCTIGDHDQTDFGCVIASAELSPGEVCGYNQQCNNGLCLDAAELPACADSSCCASLCDLLAPDECPGGTECMPLDLWSNPDLTVGVCALSG